jgi:hypothetical protein
MTLLVNGMFLGEYKPYLFILWVENKVVSGKGIVGY